MGFGQRTAAPAVLELVIAAIFIFLLWLTIGNKGSLREEIAEGKRQIEILEQENNELRSAIESLEDQVAGYKQIKTSLRAKEYTPKKSMAYPRITLL